MGVVGESSGASATRQVVGVSTQSSLPRTIFEQGGHAYTAEPAARRRPLVRRRERAPQVS